MPTPTLKLRLCEQLLADQVTAGQLFPFHSAVAALDTDERHYWIGTFYTLLLSASERRSQAAYFTPPHLAHGVIGLVQKAGFDLRKHTVVDPAAGGAAFLSIIADHMQRARSASHDVVSRLSGMEIDPALARLSERLIANRLNTTIESGSIVSHRDSLSLRSPGRFDLVIANPPYGRLLEDPSGLRWREVCHAGHINKFALFTELCFRLAKRDGLIALVLPSSFVTGPLYDKLRTFIRKKGEVLTVGAVTDRDDVFVDVCQDVTVLVVRAGKEHAAESSVVFGEFCGHRPFKKEGASGKLPADVGSGWLAPVGQAGLAKGGATLADYGAEVRAGYFVWNREQDRMRKRSYSNRDVPLIWAENVRAGTFCKPVARNRVGTDYVNFQEGASTTPIVRRDAIVLQRTTNSSQPRRLIAARVSPSVIKNWGGFVTENHTIVITAGSTKTLDALCLLLNSRAVDARYRRLSGTASVSVQLLRALDLPRPEVLEGALSTMKDPEEAVEWAYAASGAQAMEAVA